MAAYRYCCRDGRVRPDEGICPRGEAAASALRRPLSDTFVDLGMSPLCESFLTRRPARRDGAVLPAARPDLRATACSSSSRRTSPGEEIFTRVRLLLLLLRLAGSSTRARYTEAMIERFGLDADSLVVELARNDGYLLQHFVAARASRRSASSRPRTSPRPRANAASRRSSSSSARTLARRLVAEGRRADLRRRPTTSWPRCPTLNDFVAGIEIAARARRRGRRSSSRTSCG